MASTSMPYTHLLIAHRKTVNQSLMIRASQVQVATDDRSRTKSSSGAIRLVESVSNLLHLRHPTDLQYTNWNFVSEGKHSKPISMSPKERISDQWQELNGFLSSENLLDPLHPWLRREIVKYGEFAQATYDAFNFDSSSEYCGSCKYNINNLFQKVGLSQNGYKVTKYIYAMTHMDMPRWFERSHLVDTWSKNSNWMGYVAVSDDEETSRIGRRDIVVAWRGTVAPSEWYEDFHWNLEPIGQGDARVEHGFKSIYISKSDSASWYNKSSASDQVMKEMENLVQLYREKGENVSLTITGHSLGGALALLNAYEAASTIPSLPISVISFGAPRVGNGVFRDELNKMGVKTIRVAIKQDIVPNMLPEIVYRHVGTELKLDVRSSPYLKKGFNLMGFHDLETYLHLVDGFVSGNTSFRSDAKRDVTLVNKSCDMLVNELKIPPCWYQMATKGFVLNTYGKCVEPKTATRCTSTCD